MKILKHIHLLICILFGDIYKEDIKDFLHILRELDVDLKQFGTQQYHRSSRIYNIMLTCYVTLEIYTNIMNILDIEMTRKLEYLTTIYSHISMVATVLHFFSFNLIITRIYEVIGLVLADQLLSTIIEEDQKIKVLKRLIKNYEKLVVVRKEFAKIISPQIIIVMVIDIGFIIICLFSLTHKLICGEFNTFIIVLIHKLCVAVYRLATIIIAGHLCQKQVNYLLDLFQFNLDNFIAE